MSGDSTGPSDFFDVACRLDLLTAEADDLRSEATKSKITPAELVLRRGLLDSVQVDIIETLRNPRDTVPGYEILDVLGRGAMGVVYRAQQENLDRIVALKTVLVSQMSDPRAVDRFVLEGRTVGRLRHPNIVAAYDLGRHEGRLFLAMEYVEGVDLDQRLRRLGQLDEVTAWQIARQTAGGLAQAASLGIVHRDVKPANLMLVDPPPGYPLPPGVPMVKVADFGLALLVQEGEASERLTQENTTVGSPYYMAPEQFVSSGVGMEADLYALGATVYHVLAGRPPFHGLTVPQIIAAKMQREPDNLRNIRPGLAETSYQLVEGLLARRVEDRISTYEELIARIDDTLEHPCRTSRLPTTAPPVDPGEATLVDSIAAQTILSQPLFPMKGGPASTTDGLRGAATTESRAITVPARRSRWWMPVLATLLVIGIGTGLVIWKPWQTTAGPTPTPNPVVRAPPPEPVAVRTVGTLEHIFNGRNLGGWDHRSGNWIVPPDLPVLQGTNGVVGRPLFRVVEDDNPLTPEVQPRRWYRLEVSLQPVEGEHVGTHEVHFGVTSANDRDAERHVVRRTAEGLVVGRRPSDHGAFVANEALPIRNVPAASVVPITIERQPTGWFVDVGDGGQPIALPHLEREVPEFRLAAAEGTARFSDLLVIDLEPVDE